jgi:NADPH:quinone reductase-like Zn-dependent oxidoreductase
MYLVGKFAAGKSILWHAAASSVSIAGIQLSRADSASAVYATARQDAKCDFAVKELGADAAFNTTTQNWAEEVLKATDGKGVDIIVDFIGASYFPQNLEAVAKDGVIVNLGFMGGTKVPEGTDISAFIRKRIRLSEAVCEVGTRIIRASCETSLWNMRCHVSRTAGSSSS